MIETLEKIFGVGKDLTPVQMSLRALLMFLVCLGLIRFAGRRSFGQHTPLDNVLAILLGAILSRAVVGASPFMSTIGAGLTITAVHRFFAWLGIYSKFFGRVVKGEAVILYENGTFHRGNMNSCCITEKDIMESVRVCGNIDSLDKVKAIYGERSGHISVVKKEQ
jgi:uncharacterized membrane protein YcaP (DUF421 family)